MINTEKQRTIHRVTIEFDLLMAPEVVDNIKDAISGNLPPFLGYPYDVLGSKVYSFDRPEDPKEIVVKIIQVVSPDDVVTCEQSEENGGQNEEEKCIDTM